MEWTCEEASAELLRLGALFSSAELIEAARSRAVLPLADGTYRFKTVSPHAARVARRVRGDGQQHMQYAFSGEDVYLWIARPAHLTACAGQRLSCVLVLSLCVSDAFPASSADSSALWEQLLQTESRVYKDSLTGAYNRRYYDERVLSGTPKACRAVTFVCADIRRFKRINDTHGHAAGDHVLQRVTEVILAGLREEDAAIRMGGDEFLLLLPNCTAQSAADLVERLRRKINAITLVERGREIHVQADFGFSSRMPYDAMPATIDAMLLEADRNMYRDKRRVKREV